MINTQPIIIAGNPRSGTRMCATVLNANPEICITDEFLNVEMLNKLADQQISSFLKKRVDPNTLSIRKELLIKNYWLLRSNLKIIEKSKSSNFIGNKTPRVESKYALYEEIFSVNKPVYLYCARNAYSTIESIKNLKNIEWSKLSFEELFALYKKSYTFLSDMQKKFPERVFVINTDAYRHSAVSSCFQTFFEYMNINLDQAYKAKINALSPQNTMAQVRQKTKDQSSIVKLSESEINIIRNCDEYSTLESKMEWSRDIY